MSALRRWVRGERPDRDVWLTLLARLPRDTRLVLDLGAAGGEEAGFFLQHYPDARIFCFEPDERSLPALRRIDGERCRVVPVAIGSKDGPAKFYLSDRRGAQEAWPFSSSLRRPKEHLVNWPEVSFRSDPITVECRTLDSWCHEESIDTIDFLWADIQGAEIDLIAGGPRMIPRVRFFFTEYGEREYYAGQASLGALEALLPSFERVALFENSVLLENRDWPPAPAAPGSPSARLRA